MMAELIGSVKRELIFRPAVKGDIPHMVEVGRLFYESTPLPNYIEYCEESMAETMDGLISSPTGTIIVMEKCGEIVGGIAGFTLSPYFNKNVTIGQQQFFFVHPEHRSIKSLVLLELWEEWCKNKGCVMKWSGAKMNHEYPAMEKMLTRRGYEPLETVFIKGE